jgi:hypothetical protein
MTQHFAVKMLPVLPTLPPIGPWPLREEDGTAAAHSWNVGAEYERTRRKAITIQAEMANKQDLAKDRPLHYGMRVHRSVTARREERVFYAHVWLTDEDRALVYSILGVGPATYREIVQRLNGMLGRRQTRRALRSLCSRGAAKGDIQRVGRNKRARIFSRQPKRLPDSLGAGAEGQRNV